MRRQSKKTADLLGMERVTCPQCGDSNASLCRFDMTTYCDKCHYFDRGMSPEEWYAKYYGPTPVSVQETPSMPVQRTLEAWL